MSGARTWREVRAQAIAEGRITEEGVARARESSMDCWRPCVFWREPDSACDHGGGKHCWNWHRQPEDPYWHDPATCEFELFYNRDTAP